LREGYEFVVDLDLEKFFDRVNHDKLMSSLAARIEDKRVLKLIRAYLNAGVMENGLMKPTEEGAFNQPNRQVRTRMPGWCGRGEVVRPPPIPSYCPIYNEIQTLWINLLSDGRGC